jgi:hypothetical protein
MITRALAGACAALALLAGWQWHQATSSRAELAAERLAIAQQIQAATVAARAEEQRRTLKIQEASHAELLARQAAEADASRARSASVSMRQRAAQIAASCAASNPTPAASSPAADSPGDLLADLLQRVDDAAGEIGRYADQARIAGQLCVSSYEALRQ